MRIRFAIEDIEPGHWVGYALDLPGCFSAAGHSEAVVAQAENSLRGYFAWLAKHGAFTLEPEIPIDVEVVERFRSYESADTPGYIVNAFFEHDKQPLTFWEVEAALRLAAWSRSDLLDTVQQIEQDRLAKRMAAEKFGSIAGILEHIAKAENWYFDRMQLGLESDRLPEDVFAMLEAVRENTRRQLVRLIGDSRILKHSGETWSGRKVVRRLLWHERDHRQHIRELSAQVENR
jgi:uncharacterized damage-inducible protein DinB